MPTVSASVVVALDATDARDLWLDTRRWATFVDGFGHVARVKGDWPAEGSRVTWESTPHGRGTVSETMLRLRAGEATAGVRDARITGTQTATFRLTPAGTAVAVSLEYRLESGNVLLDLLFIRRAQRDALRRTVARFAREADAEADLAAGG